MQERHPHTSMLNLRGSWVRDSVPHNSATQVAVLNGFGPTTPMMPAKRISKSSERDSWDMTHFQLHASQAGCASAVAMYRREASASAPTSTESRLRWWRAGSRSSLRGQNTMHAKCQQGVGFTAAE